MRLLDQVRHVIRKKYYSIRTEHAYTDWIKKFIMFHNKRHPKDMGEKEISQYISYLAVKKNVAASTQNQALNAIVFLYKQVLKRELGDFGSMERAKRTKRLPTVLTKNEADLVLTVMSGKNALMAKLLYGCGLRLMECLRLRVKDIEFEGNQVMVRDGKGPKDRVTMLPTQSNTTPKKGGLMVTLKGSSIKAYSPQSRKDRRVFGFSFLLFVETPKSKITQLFVEYNI